MIRAGLTAFLIATLAACSPAAVPSTSEGAATPSGVTSATREPSAGATLAPTPEATLAPTREPTAAPVDPAAFTLDASGYPGAYAFVLTEESEITLDSEEAYYGAGSQRRADLEGRGFVAGWSRSFQSGDQRVLSGSSAYIFDAAEGARMEQEAQAAEYSSCKGFDAGGVIGDASYAALCKGPRKGGAGIIIFAQGAVVVSVLWSGTFVNERGPNLDLLAQLARDLRARIGA